MTENHGAFHSFRTDVQFAMYGVINLVIIVVSTIVPTLKIQIGTNCTQELHTFLRTPESCYNSLPQTEQIIMQLITKTKLSG